ncbi:MAG: chitobiase/beta-hexosaminidase C-terminal domain-containing protein, partial [Clostridia bacterium]|nr:chitobiase/beta-hexosaminidase C-terminal domain-containing protein [Clostridia bacterium]
MSAPAIADPSKGDAGSPSSGDAAGVPDITDKESGSNTGEIAGDSDAAVEPTVEVKAPLRSVPQRSASLDAPGTRNDTVVVTPGDSTTPLNPTVPKEDTSEEPETDFDENSPYSPRIAFGTGSGLYARWGTSELANEYYLTPDDTVTIATSNEPDGAKVYFTGLNTAIEAYKADPAFDFTAAGSGWTEYTDSVTIQFNDNYARIGAVMVDSSGRAIKGTFVSTNFWELDCDRWIGVYGSAGNYNIRMTDYLNLSGATATNITQKYYIKVAVGEAADTPSESNYDFRLTDSQPGYLSEYLDSLTGNKSLNYKGICVYYKSGTAVYTSPVSEGTYDFELSPTIAFKNKIDNTDILYYPCTLSATILYGGSFNAIYYSIGKIGSTTSTSGWTRYRAANGIEVSGDIDAGDVALYAVLYDTKAKKFYSDAEGSSVIFEKPLIRVGNTVISGDGQDGDTATSTITIETVGIPDGYTARIYYTLDGGNPEYSGLLYTGPISTANYSKDDVITVKAYSVLTDGESDIEGTVAEREITVTGNAPEISVSGGTVTISNGAGTVYYTVDGSDPRSSATRAVYSTGFSLDGLNRRVRAVGFSDGNYSAVSEIYADGGNYALGTLALPYSSGETPVEFFVSNVKGKSGDYVDNSQEITFTIPVSGIVSFDMAYENVDGGSGGYNIYRPYIRNADDSLHRTFDSYENDGYTHYHKDASLPAGAYTLVIPSDRDCVFRVNIKNITVFRDDKVFFGTGSVTVSDEPYISDRGFYLYLSTVKQNSAIYYNYTTDGSTPADPTLSSATSNGYSVVYVGSEKPHVKIKASVYDADTGTFGNVYSAELAYVGVFDIYAVDGDGNRSSVSWSNINGTDYNVIYDKTGGMYVGMTDISKFFPGSAIDIEYYLIPNDRNATVFNNGTLNAKAIRCMSGQKVTLADMAAVAGVDDYRKSWGFYVRAGARVTVDGKVYYFNSDNAGYVYSMPAKPVVTANGSTVTLSTESTGAKLYYSLRYNPPIGGNPSGNYTEYTGPITLDRNFTLTAVASWEGSVSYDGLQNGHSTTALQFIAANTIKSFSVAELTENGQESSEYFIPVVAGEMSQSVDFT